MNRLILCSIFIGSITGFLGAMEQQIFVPEDTSGMALYAWEVELCGRASRIKRLIERGDSIHPGQIVAFFKQIERFNQEKAEYLIWLRNARLAR